MKTRVRCDFCGTIFEKESRRYNESVKNGSNQYCSTECRRNVRLKGEYRNCLVCRKEFWARPCDDTKGKRLFCSSSCSCGYNNRRRGGLSEETKKKIQDSLVKYYSKTGQKRCDKICETCGNVFKGRKEQKCCSRKCSVLLRFGDLPLTKEEVLTRICEVSEKLGHIPSSKRVKIQLMSSAKRFFGSWNKAIESCGLKPNKQLFSFKLRCNDGHVADSISERTIDNWFFDIGLKHEKNKQYPKSKMTCDFWLKDYDIWIEYFGLSGASLAYDSTIELKQEVARKNGLKLVSIFPKDIYPKNKLKEILIDKGVEFNGL
jgi:hypothetical protein